MDSAAIKWYQLYQLCVLCSPCPYESACTVMCIQVCTPYECNRVCMAVESVTLSKPQSPRTKPTGGDPAGLISTFQGFRVHKLYRVEDQRYVVGGRTFRVGRNKDRYDAMTIWIFF